MGTMGFRASYRADGDSLYQTAFGLPGGNRSLRRHDGESGPNGRVNAKRAQTRPKRPLSAPAVAPRSAG